MIPWKDPWPPIISLYVCFGNGSDPNVRSPVFIGFLSIIYFISYKLPRQLFVVPSTIPSEITSSTQKVVRIVSSVVTLLSTTQIRTSAPVPTISTVSLLTGSISVLDHVSGTPSSYRPRPPCHFHGNTESVLLVPLSPPVHKSLHRPVSRFPGPYLRTFLKRKIHWLYS